jgi:chemotaxis protein histidine kinase CheA
LKAVTEQLKQGTPEPPPVDLGRTLGGSFEKPPLRQPEPEIVIPEPTASRSEPELAIPEPTARQPEPEPELTIPEPPQAPEGGRILGIPEPKLEIPETKKEAEDEFFVSKDLSRFAAPAVDESVPATGENTFFIHVFFNEGSKMENIRAFMLVNKLSEKGEVVRTVPSELENSPEAAIEIAENGFYISYISNLFKEQIEAIAKGTLSVETVSFVRKMPEAPSYEEVGFQIGERDEVAPESGDAPQIFEDAPPRQTPVPDPSIPEAPSTGESAGDTRQNAFLGGGGVDAHQNAFPGESAYDTHQNTAPGESAYATRQSAAPQMAPGPEEQTRSQLKEENAEKSSPAAQQAPEPPAKKAPAAAESAPAAEKRSQQNIISVDLTKLDTLLDLVGEIVIHESLVTENPDLDGLETPNFDKSARELDKLTNELQDTVMAIRMIPVSSSFHRMRRIVRDMSKALGKEVELMMVGESTEVDKTILDAISDPLMHLVRNAMDHAIESADDRVAAGKNPSGCITLSAVNSGSDVIISVTDDGRGLDIDTIVSKAKERGLLRKPESEYSEKEIYNLLMAPGFSTRSSATEYSGRGVGMDVVKSNIEKIGGTVLLESKKGQGTNVMLKIPLTLAIISCMEVRLGDDIYSIPVANIREALKADAGQIITDPNGNEMILLRGEPYPVVRLYEVFGKQGAIEEIEDGILVLVASEDRKACLLSDELIGKFQVVAKPLPSYLSGFNISRAGISGCTILGNGEVSLIVNTQELLG